ncbi:hypothetical protein IP90_00777 [Luteimonas cucumeris]|uniref:Uncharacterized protein n=1 Tax=Luteimonas cucumeris TaxID=985012 RepID=A0A562LAZ9_9GAMM|nr:hypothetical protein [Luteimonas cucumeris]TWI04644.1 hypothetical protein IP90_00777 [Luteimonas cucumeris]
MTFLICLLITVVLVEALLMFLWSRSYFSWGLPVFKQCIAAPAAALSHLPFNWLEGEYPPASWASIVFEPLSGNMCAFRESLLMPRGPGYLPIMRGLIVADRQRREIRVIGWCNWSILLIAASLVPALVVMPAVALFFVGVLGASYLVQRRRFQNVAIAVGALLETNKEWPQPIGRTPPPPGP